MRLASFPQSLITLDSIRQDDSQWNKHDTFLCKLIIPGWVGYSSESIEGTAQNSWFNCDKFSQYLWILKDSSQWQISLKLLNDAVRQETPSMPSPLLVNPNSANICTLNPQTVPLNQEKSGINCGVFGLPCSWCKCLIWTGKRKRPCIPISWATVKAACRPSSSMTAQLRSGEHMVPTSAIPRVSHEWCPHKSCREKERNQENQFTSRRSHLVKSLAHSKWQD